MSSYETKHQTALQQFEIDAFQGLKADIAEYADRVLPWFINMVDTHIGWNCNDMRGKMDDDCLRMNLQTLLVASVETGGTFTPPARPGGRGSFSYQHQANAIVDAATGTPMLVLDAIGMAMGGQRNVESGSYYRWPAKVWSATKSVHYGGMAGRSVWHRPGTYRGNIRGQGAPVGTPF